MRLPTRRARPEPPRERPRERATERAPDPADEPPDDAARARDPALAAERRLRAAGGPEDRSLYRCACGYIFDAAVSTAVACPHCGATQAW